MIHYETLIDGTCFGLVRQYLHNARSDIAEVLFVASEDLLPEMARLLDAENESSAEFRRFRWAALLRGGQVIPNAHTQGFGLDVDAVPQPRHQSNECTEFRLAQLRALETAQFIARKALHLSLPARMGEGGAGFS